MKFGSFKSIVTIPDTLPMANRVVTIYMKIAKDFFISFLIWFSYRTLGTDAISLKIPRIMMQSETTDDAPALMSSMEHEETRT